MRKLDEKQRKKRENINNDFRPNRFRFIAITQKRTLQTFT